MKTQHHPHHWLVVVLVLAALLLTLTEAHGQSAGNTMVPDGPVVAGAQGGIGMPDTAGGITQRGDGVKPARDRSVAKDHGTSAKKIKRAAKRTATRSRHGVSEIDSGLSKSTTR